MAFEFQVGSCCYNVLIYSGSLFPGLGCVGVSPRAYPLPFFVTLDIKVINRNRSLISTGFARGLHSGSVRMRIRRMCKHIKAAHPKLDPNPSPKQTLCHYSTVITPTTAPKVTPLEPFVLATPQIYSD